MIYEHKIPNRSKLYFGKSATLKREIEYKASNVDELDEVVKIAPKDKRDNKKYRV